MRSFRCTFNNDKLYLNSPTTVSLYIYICSYPAFKLGRQCSFPFSINLCAVELSRKSTIYIYNMKCIYRCSTIFPVCSVFTLMPWMDRYGIPYWLVHAEANLLTLCAYSYQKPFVFKSNRYRSLLSSQATWIMIHLVSILIDAILSSSNSNSSSSSGSGSGSGGRFWH